MHKFFFSFDLDNLKVLSYFHPNKRVDESNLTGDEITELKSKAIDGTLALAKANPGRRFVVCEAHGIATVPDKIYEPLL